MAEGKEHLSIVICGHVDSGKSTTSKCRRPSWVVPLTTLHSTRISAASSSGAETLH